jgi:hypothetical protein
VAKGAELATPAQARVQAATRELSNLEIKMAATIITASSQMVNSIFRFMVTHSAITAG